MPMQKRRGADLLMRLDRTASGEGLTRQIYAQLRAAILDGRLRAGDRLPPSRDLARDLGVARLTVATAYEWLSAEGYVYGRVGAGTFVAPSSSYAPSQRCLRHQHTAPRLTRPNTPETASEAPVPLSRWARRIATIPLRAGSVPPKAPPAPGICVPVSARRTPSPGRAGAGSSAGPTRWRAMRPPADVAYAAARRPLGCAAWPAGDTRGHRGVAAALAGGALPARADSGGGQRAADAGVAGAAADRAGAAPAGRGPQLCRLPRGVSGGGRGAGGHARWMRRASGWRRCPRRSMSSGAVGPRLAIVTPSHQYPTGVTLSLERRVALLEWARRAGVVLVEDDYDGDLRLEGQPLEALRGLDDRDEVIYLGTFAKALYPGRAPGLRGAAALADRAGGARPRRQRPASRLARRDGGRALHRGWRTGAPPRPGAAALSRAARCARRRAARTTWATW